MKAEKDQKMIYIVIPVHNRKHFTRKCLLSLKRQTFQGFKVIVVDDGSTDGTEKMITDEFPEVVLLKGDGNLWWAGATNRGVEYVLDRARDDDCVITLNDDTVVRPDFIQTLVNSASKYPKSLIGSVSVSDEDESVVFEASVCVNWLTAKYNNIGKGKQYDSILKSILKSDSFFQQSDVVSGRGTIIPVEVFREVGLYDFKRLPHHGADYEFSRRANLKGYDLLINYKAIVVGHVEFTGLNSKVSRIRWRDLIKSFFSIRSPNSLKYRLIFARLCCVGMRFLVFYACDVGRLLIGSFLSQTGILRKLP